MILTYKVKHSTDLTEELKKAKQVAEHALKTKTRSSADVKHIGLKSAISNQILKKYSSNKVLKQVKSVKLTVPNQAIKYSNETIQIPCLHLSFPFSKPFLKINQIELDVEYAYVSCTVEEQKSYEPTSWIGVDLNVTGHCVVAGNSTTGKVLKMGKKAQHIRKKYRAIRKKLQKLKKYKAVKRIKNKESRIIRDLNHKMSIKLINDAKKQQAGLVLERLTGIGNNKKHGKSFRYALNSWSFYQFKQFLMYKTKLYGVRIVEIDPKYTSQQCSCCGLLGERNGKSFKCSCGHVENADVNASFVISKRHQGFQLPVDRDTGKGNTDVA